MGNNRRSPSASHSAIVCSRSPVRGVRYRLNNQSVVSNHQLLVRHLSTVNCQLSTVNCQLSTQNFSLTQNSKLKTQNSRTTIDYQSISPSSLARTFV
ncbi:MAG: hypothetical protein HC849_09780 [Oscillatoriales cyanobacterium RU_3_3]|nr:hypothetical protein [Microcoleus sp. SM1_3_4]NJM60414.1 hypothetical protein [Oscillatoriales cyanobacterium RU_3_3]